MATIRRIKRRLWHTIARHRDARVFIAAARVASGYLTAYEARASFEISLDGELRVLEVFATNDPVVLLDVGANIGEWTVEATRLLPNAMVHAFEPVGSTHEMLRSATSGLGDRVATHRVALGAESGEALMNVPAPGSPLSSLTADRSSGAEVVRVVRGDDWCREQGIDRVRFLKVDTEGWDHHVLQGFESMLAGGQVDAVQFEYGKWALETRFLLKDFFSLLESCDMTVGKIYPSRVAFGPYTSGLEDFTGLNYLAVKRSQTDLVRALAGGGEGPRRVRQ